MVDREVERSVIDGILDALADGLGGVRVLTGDAGMGKTRLLRHAVESRPDLDHIWIAGVETERELGFAGLHRLLRPFLARRGQLPARQLAALESALGIGADGPADRFLVGLATLTLLADAAAEQGLVCVVDDAQWIDRESLQALAFAARRLEADRVAILFGVRDPMMVSGVLDGLPCLPVVGLPVEASLALLSRIAASPVDAEVALHLVDATSGCPLALIELATGLSPDQLLSGFRDGEPLPIGQRLEEHFSRVVEDLEPSAQTFLLVASAEWSGNPMLVRRAVRELGADGDGEDVAVASGLVAVGATVEFRHPLVRLAVYGAAPRALRDTVHRTLADLVDGLDPDRHLRHLAAAARDPDEALALQLEQAAARSRDRGGYAAESSWLVEAAHLTPVAPQRARRLLLAATAALSAGMAPRAEALLAQARPDLDDPLLVIDAMRLDGRLRVPLADSPAAPGRLLAVARALEPIDHVEMRAVLLEAMEHCIVSQHLTADVSPVEIARVALAARDAATDPPTHADMVLEGIAHAYVCDYASAVPIFRQVSEAIRGGSVSPAHMLRLVHVYRVICEELFDDVAFNAWVLQVEQSARDAGALIALQLVLLARAERETRAGRFAAAEVTYDEAVKLSGMIGHGPELLPLINIRLAAWRGREKETRAGAAVLAERATSAGTAVAVSLAQRALAILELGLGRYKEALAAIAPVVDVQQVGATCLGLAIAVEAAARSGDHDRARRYLADLEQRASLAGTQWGLGQLARCRALVADDSHAKDLHLEAIERLSATSMVVELAQARLAYGEWLRRQQRRIDARALLRAAHDAFDQIGAEAFAARARSELEATGETITRRGTGPVLDLTPQEAQAARFAITGATNAEIADRMFVSANTVDYHLRKVYRKLGIGSRRELATVIPALAAPEEPVA
jgi:DNA-binding CsgD family transcriptional regulator